MKRLRIRPSAKLIKYLAIATVLSLLTPIAGYYWSVDALTFVPLIVLISIVVIGVVDLFVSRTAPAIAIGREIPDNLSVFEQQNVTFALANRDEMPLHIEAAEMVPEHWQVSNSSFECNLAPNESIEFSYTITPLKRGPSTIAGTELRTLSYFGFWQITWWREYLTQHKVFPNFAAITDLAGLHGSVNLTQAGLKKFNQRGSGMDFLQLRDYREGDSLRQVDWRATSRFNKFISREFQEEKNQNIIIMLDSGRRMCVQDDELSYFDHALNAIIMLSYTALKNGDNLSLQSFGTESRWLSQVKGAQNVSHVLNHFYDLYPQKIASDYLAAAQELIVKQPKRALILLVSCLRDEDFADLLIAVRLLQAKHLVAVISINEPVYQQLASNKVSSFESALDYAASEKLQQSIDKNIQRLKQQGVICMRASADKLTPSVINTYLSVKKAGLL